MKYTTIILAFCCGVFGAPHARYLCGAGANGPESPDSYQDGYDLGKQKFESMWDKNCTTLTSELVESVQLARPKFMAKCKKYGYYSGIDETYKTKSLECFPDCKKGVGKPIGLKLGKAFCKGEEPEQDIDTTCNAVEAESCGDAFFDYTFANCNDQRRADDYSKYFMYMKKWCNY